MNSVDAIPEYCILYVDDEEKSLKYFDRYFSSRYKVLTALNATEARMILDERSAEIGVLISDQRMPLEKGVELLKYARETYPGIVRLLTTAYSDLHDAIEAVNRGEILRYIPKPWDLNFLEMEIRHALRFFMLNQERDHLRREKLSTLQRVISCSRVKDLIVLSAGMTHLRNPMHAIRSCLLQISSRVDPAGNFKILDLRQMMNDEIDGLFAMAAIIRRETTAENNLLFEPLDLLPLFRIHDSGGPSGIRIAADPDSTTIVANPCLMDRLARLLLENLCMRPAGQPGAQIMLSRHEAFLRIAVAAARDWSKSTILDIPAWLPCIYYICHHHGGSVTIEEGGDWIIRLPYTQHSAEPPVLPPDWLDDLMRRYDIMSG
jgi:FixJ family two-component response regulator